jgi:hypothetical protein
MCILIEEKGNIPLAFYWRREKYVFLSTKK